MIERIYSEPELPKHGIEVQKIRALYLSYGARYDFCRFYKQNGSAIASLDGSFVLYSDSTADYCELAEFFGMNGFTDIFCTKSAADSLARYLKADYHAACIMKFCGEPQKAEITECTSPGDMYDIIRTCFEIDFEPWYLDMSHRIRHGVTRGFMLGNKAALVVQHNINGEALMSQISVPAEYRLRGYASTLIKAVCAELSPSECYVICEEGLKGFYEKSGFEQTGESCIISPT